MLEPQQPPGCYFLPSCSLPAAWPVQLESWVHSPGGPRNLCPRAEGASPDRLRLFAQTSLACVRGYELAMHREKRGSVRGPARRTTKR